MAEISESKVPIVRILSPFQRFFHNEATGGILLLAFTFIALIWANSPLADTYDSFWHTHLVIGAGSFKLDKSLIHWVNDGLMVIFFFVVGLEIKREIMIGELASRRKAALPIAAALGGMVVPAAVFLLVNNTGAAADGWGVPMATDIAFALGILSLLGKRAPLSLKIFLTALAIVDDIGAILVIALFYTSEISTSALIVAAIFFGLLILANRLGVRHPLIYTLLSLGLWVAFLKSGVHATVAGVLAAMTIPARTLINADQFIQKAHYLIHEFECGECGEYVLPNKQQRAALQALEGTIQHVESPMQRLEHSLHPWVSFVIMPVFALANAGVALNVNLFDTLTEPLSVGIIAGLVIGKPLGVTLVSWLSVRLGLADLPQGLSWLQIHGAAWLSGIGFTMSLFIANLAFEGSALLNAAKLGILAASIAAGVVGWLLLRSVSPIKRESVAAVAQT